MVRLYHCRTLYVGPERNSIRGIIRDVDWKDLAYQLDLINQTASIQGTCNMESDPVTCYLREVLDRFIQSQPCETCNKTVEKITTALEKLGSRYGKNVNELRRMFAMGELYVCVV